MCNALQLWPIFDAADKQSARAIFAAKRIPRSNRILSKDTRPGPRWNSAGRGFPILLFPRDGNVAGKDGVPEMGLRTKNGKLHGGIFFSVKDR